MVQPVRQRVPYAEYLELDAASPDRRFEFLDESVWAMAGGSPAHAAVAANLIAALAGALRGRPCRVFSSDLRVRVLETGLATYPDVTVICGPVETDPDDPRGHTATNPSLVAEVLSPSTEAYDRGEKLAHYKRVPSLQHVVLVAHDAERLEVWTRTETPGREGWRLAVAESGELALSALDLTLSVAEVYRDPTR